ncbi:hypothetical protein [Teredinibacter turnerae]|uniref:hypothetical protein n=1 Tax=Teredinibacter turnerae TaxID=2426 RepID=UPI00036ED9CE|nr:hypothetical protein [Teredinibacter turnerae]
MYKFKAELISFLYVLSIYIALFMANKNFKIVSLDMYFPVATPLAIFVFMWLVKVKKKAGV